MDVMRQTDRGWINATVPALLAPDSTLPTRLHSQSESVISESKHSFIVLVNYFQSQDSK